ncbi:hypothetical protein [Salinibacter sp.]|uniref:hypothetical protein n=1 Tax=Salinibacter sp. TaxID=2065818 RepID=UPI0021E79910|nr:hypothetical protein [Salinibacter sp.]
MDEKKTLKHELDERLRQLPEAQLREVLNYVESLRDDSSSPPSIEEKIAARVADIPDEALEDLPADASENLDHYLYGGPKK